MPNEKSRLDAAVAVIGDVNVDWVFLSPTLAPPRPTVSPGPRAWKDSPQVELLPIPGGAWYVAAMMAGALRAGYRSKSTLKLEPSEGTDSRAVSFYSLAGEIERETCLTVHIENIDVLSHELREVFHFQKVQKGGCTLVIKVTDDKVRCLLHIKGGTLKCEATATLGYKDDLTNRSWVIEAADLSPHAGGRLELTRMEVDGGIEIKSIKPATNAKAQVVGFLIPAGDAQGRIALQIGDPLRLRNVTVRDIASNLKISSTISDEGQRLIVPCECRGGTDDALHVHRDLIKDLHRDRIEAREPTVVYSLSLPALRDLKAGEIIQSLARLDRCATLPGRSASSASKAVFRRRERCGIAGPAHTDPIFLKRAPRFDKGTKNLQHLDEWSGARRRLLVVDDEGFGFSRTPRWWKPWLEANAGSGEGPVILVKCGRNSPVHREIDDYPLQTSLYGFVRALDRPLDVVLLLTSNALHRGIHTTLEIGAAKMVSWELMLEDFQRAIHAGHLDLLDFAGHLIVQFGMEGALYFRRTDRRKGKIVLVYDRGQVEGSYADRGTFGEIMGASSVMTACVAQAIVSAEEGALGTPAGMTTIVKGLEEGLKSCRRQYDFGFGAEVDVVQRFERLDLPTIQIFHAASHREDRLATVVIGEDDDRLAEDRSWSILSKWLMAEIVKKGAGGAGRDVSGMRQSAVKLGKEIVRSGLKRAGGDFPILTYGKLTTIDRGEIEDLRTIRNAIDSYWRRGVGEPSRLSVAVFGPAGSGKGFGIKQVIESLRRDNNLEAEFIEINLTQVSSFDEVSHELLRVPDANMRNALPVVFFDEFDCRHESGRYRWLDRFLMPMQDGLVRIENRNVRLGRAVFVFAGGTSVSYEAFDVSAGSGTEAIQFREQKGPDFVSRLSAHLNVVGPNAPEVTGGGVSPGDELIAQAYLRRAVLLRSLIKGSYPRLLHGDTASVDDRVLGALLTVNRYRHGARSVEAMLRMCRLTGEEHFGVAHFPLWSQLGMHVSDDFLDKIAG